MDGVAIEAVPARHINQLTLKLKSKNDQEKPLKCREGRRKEERKKERSKVEY